MAATSLSASIAAARSTLPAVNVSSSDHGRHRSRGRVVAQHGARLLEPVGVEIRHDGVDIGECREKFSQSLRMVGADHQDTQQSLVARPPRVDSRKRSSTVSRNREICRDADVELPPMW